VGRGGGGNVLVTLTDESCRKYSDWIKYEDHWEAPTGATVEGCITGSKKTLDGFHKFISSFMDGGVVQGDALQRAIGEGWGSCVGTHFDGRGMNFLRTKVGLDFTSTCVWRDLDKFRFRWQDLRYLFRYNSETNDTDGVRFPEQLMTVCCRKVDVGDGRKKYLIDKKYFEKQEDALRYIGEFMGVSAPKSANAVKSLTLPDDKYAYCKLLKVKIV